MQRTVAVEVEVVTHLEVGLCTFGNAKGCDLHIALAVEGLGHLYLDKALLGVDDAFILTIELELLNEARTADVDAARVVLGTGDESKGKECAEADDIMLDFHILLFIRVKRRSEGF